MLTFAILARITLAAVRTAAIRLWRAEQHGIVGVSLHVLLQILRTFEGFAAEVALVWLQRHVNADVRGNVITLDCGGTAVAPLTSKVQIVGALATNMALTDVVLQVVSTSRTKWRAAVI